MIPGFLKKLGADAATLVARIRCPGCGEAELQEWGFCESCAPKLKLVEGPICLRCGSVMPAGVSSDRESCSWCEKNAFRFDSLRAAYLYEYPLRDAVVQFKFKKKQALAGLFGKMMVDDIVDRPGMYSTIFRIDMVVPVPVHLFRFVTRGFNQSEMLARAVSARVDAPVTRVLKRTKYARPRANMTFEERKSSVKGAFACRRGAELKGKDVLLIDDVATTCSTASECARVLKKGGARSVHVFTLARKGQGG